MWNARVTEADAGTRLDRWLAQQLDLPRNRIQQWIAAGRVQIGSRQVKASTPLVAGDAVICDPPAPPTAPGLIAEPGPLALLFEDPHLIVIDKPAGLVVHPGAGRPQGTLVNNLLARYPELAGIGGPGRPGIVHRLDKDTTGVLVIARTDTAYRRLSTAFADRTVSKTYFAIVYGAPRQARGRIELPLGRHRHDRTRMAVHPRGRPARTAYQCLGQAAGLALLEIDLETGRTHQIRVHLKAMGHPLVGDPVYGEARWRGLPGTQRGPLRRFPRPALHAWRLGFAHPVSGLALRFTAPVPDDMKTLWKEATGEGWPAD